MTFYDQERISNSFRRQWQNQGLCIIVPPSICVLWKVQPPTQLRKGCFCYKLVWITATFCFVRAHLIILHLCHAAHWFLFLCKEIIELTISRWNLKKIVIERNFGRNSGFKSVSAETKIKECFERNYLNFRAFILPLLSVERAAFRKTEKLQVISRNKATTLFSENSSK